MTRLLPPTSRAMAGQVLGQSWPMNRQAVDFSQESHRAAPGLKTAIYHMFSGTCSLLRQVCGLSGWNIRPSVLPLPCIRSGSARAPAFVRPRPGCSFFLARRSALLLLLEVALPSAALAEDNWISGSSFDQIRSATDFSTRATFGPADGFNGSASPSPRSRRASGSVAPRFSPDPQLGDLENLRSLIALAEAGAGGYDAVVYGAAVLPPAAPTELCLGDIREWVRRSPGQNHAIGRYQFVPATFERLATITGSADNDVFSEALQDRWANRLLQEAGYLEFLIGEISPDDFMDNLARIWAGLPLEGGTSAYENLAGNHATIDRSLFSHAIAKIFPVQIAMAEAAQSSGKGPRLPRPN